MIKIKRTVFENLESLINEIGYNKILNIIPEHCYDGCYFVIIYSEVQND